MKPGAPISQRTVHDALILRKQGKTQMEIAVELGVAQGTVSVILRANGAGGQLVRVRRSLLLRPETKP